MPHNHANIPPLFRLPPLVFLAPLLAGLWLDTFAPLPLPLSLWLARVLGISLIVVSVALAGWAAAALRRAGTTVEPTGEATALVTGGPFRYSRNPLYVAQALGTAGVAIFFNTWWPLLFLPLSLLVITLWVVRPEEAYLEATFGDAYRAYRRRVRRWV